MEGLTMLIKYKKKTSKNWCQTLKVEGKGAFAMPVIDKELDFTETTY